MLEGTLTRLTSVKISYDFAMHEGRYPVFRASYGVRSSLLLQQPTTTTPAHWANHARHDLWERKVPDIKPRAAICLLPYQHLPLLARIQRPNYLTKKMFWNFIVLISCYSKSTRLWIKSKQFKTSAKSRDQNIWFTKSSEAPSIIIWETFTRHIKLIITKARTILFSLEFMDMKE